jgi:hypothetical protein
MIGSTPRPVPTEAQIDLVTKQLFNNPDFVIAAVVNHNFPAVRARYARFTNAPAPTDQKKMVAVLQAMRSAGRKTLVRRIISVPWEVRGDGTVMDRAVRNLRGEHLSRLNSPLMGKRNVGADGQGDNDSFDPFAGGTVYGPQNYPGSGAPVDPQEERDWLSSLPGILAGLGGLVGAFTGNIAAPSGGGGNSPAPPAASTNWLNVGLILVGIAALTVVVAVVIRAAKNK